MDSDFFNRKALAAQTLVTKTLRLGDLVEDGYRVVYESTATVDRTEGEALHWPYFLQSADITTPFISAASMGCVKPSDWERYPKGRIQPGELLIEVKGKAEKLAIVPDDFPKNTLVSGTCFKLTTKSPDDRYWLLAYLTCRYGQLLKDRLKTNLLISYIAKDDLYSLPVPHLSSILVATIKQTVESAFAAFRKARASTSAAELQFLRTTNLEKWSPQEPLTYVRSSRDVATTGRMDAEHFKEKFYAAKHALLASGAKSFASLPTLLDSLTNGQTPLRHDLSVGDVPFLCAEHVADFTLHYGSEKRILLSHHNKELSRTKLRNGDVLLTIKGRVGNAAIVENIVRPVNINQDVALLRFNDKLPLWYIVAYINCRFGKLQSEKMATGAINPFLGLFSIRQFEVPIFEQAVMDEIAIETRNHVTDARHSDERSTRLLEAAKRAVEIAIEDSEAAALAYLEKVAEPVR